MWERQLHETTATIFHETLSQYRAAEVLEEADRGLCRLGLAEEVLACGEINQCPRSRWRRRFSDF